MRFLAILSLLGLLAGCAMPVSCADRKTDGGIGGTGDCKSSEADKDVLALKTFAIAQSAG